MGFARRVVRISAPFAWLTGELATDPSTASGYGCYELETGRSNAAALTAAGLAGRGSRADGTGRGIQAGSRRGPGLPAVWPSAASRPLRPEAAARPNCASVPVVLGPGAQIDRICAVGRVSTRRAVAQNSDCEGQPHGPRGLR
jgi:hypothetical protein